MIKTFYYNILLVNVLLHKVVIKFFVSFKKSFTYNISLVHLLYSFAFDFVFNTLLLKHCKELNVTLYNEKFNLINEMLLIFCHVI